MNTSGIIITIAGTGIAGYSGDDSAATSAKLNGPSGVTVDGSGNVYISDNYNHRIRKVNTSGIITTVAGTGVLGYNGDGIPASTATLYSPHGIAVDGHGNLYICDVLNNRLRKVNNTGIITTIAGTGAMAGYGGDGGQATATDIGQPFGVAIDASGNVFFADESYNRVCKINTLGIISTIAGTGFGGYNGDNISATTAELNQPFGVAVDGMGNVYIADVYNNRIRKMNISGIITTYAGTGIEGYSGDGGPATLAELYGPVSVTTDGNGNIFIADDNNLRIRYVKNTLSVYAINESIESPHVYTNPSFTGSFTATILSSSDNQIQIFITDIVGEKIKEISIATNKPSEINLDVPNGIYFLSVITMNGIVTKKVIVQRHTNIIHPTTKIYC